MTLILPLNKSELKLLKTALICLHKEDSGFLRNTLIREYLQMYYPKYVKNKNKKLLKSKYNTQRKYSYVLFNAILKTELIEKDYKTGLFVINKKIFVKYFKSNLKYKNSTESFSVKKALKLVDRYLEMEYLSQISKDSSLQFKRNQPKNKALYDLSDTDLENEYLIAKFELDEAFKLNKYLVLDKLEPILHYFKKYSQKHNKKMAKPQDETETI